MQMARLLLEERPRRDCAVFFRHRIAAAAGGPKPKPKPGAVSGNTLYTLGSRHGCLPFTTPARRLLPTGHVHLLQYPPLIIEGAGFLSRVRTSTWVIQTCFSWCVGLFPCPSCCLRVICPSSITSWCVDILQKTKKTSPL